LDKAVIDFNESDIEDPVLRNIFSVLGSAYSEGKEITLDRIFDLFPEGQEKALLEENIIDSYSIDDPGSAYTEIYIILKLYEIDKKIEHFARLLKQESVSGNMQDYLTEIEVWRREKEKLSSYLYNLHNVDHTQTMHSF
jgi:hypothetical protein